jgi:esterase/lipase superfamily enzyme
MVKAAGTKPLSGHLVEVSAMMIACAAILGGCATKVRELMPTPALFDHPAARAIFEKVPARRRTDYVDLLYITDRAPNSDPGADLPYGQERSRSLAFGSARVSLLPQMQWDELRRQSLANLREQPIELKLDRVKELGRYPTEPYSVQVTTQGVTRDPATLEQHELAEAKFKSEVRKRLRTAPSREVVLYIHGFNETFATAAYTAAELCHFLGRMDVCSFFTWPASSTGGPLTSYISTTESSQYSVGHLKKAIRTLAQTPGVEGLHLLAHSRGNALLLSAVRELYLETVAFGESPAESLKLKNIVMLSPDVDVDVASQQLEIVASDPDFVTRWHSAVLPKFIEGRFTVYASPGDKALRLSEFLFRSRSRVGQLSPEDIPPRVQEFFSKVQTSRNRRQTTRLFGQFDRGSGSKRRVPNLDAQPLPTGNFGPQAGELAAQLLLSRAAGRLL